MKSLFATVVLAAGLLGPAIEMRAAGQEPASKPSNNTGGAAFPEANEVLQGRTFATKGERDVFFLRGVRERFPASWSALIEANITVRDYVQAPEKLLRFIEELGTATAGTSDLIASTNLAAIVSDPAFYANTNAYRPEIQQAAALTLIRIGPNGIQALARSFSEEHYRADPASLEDLAEAVGNAGTPDVPVVGALGAAVFTFSTTNGGCYPQCTERITRSLLRLPGGPAAVVAHLTTNEIFGDPGRFQAVVDGIAAGQAAGLATNLTAIQREVAAKLAIPGFPAGPYRDDLQDLHGRIQRAIAQLQKAGEKAGR
jgi:hypothetical protein